MLEQAVEAEAARAWRATPAVRAEFGTLARYTAYVLAAARGLVGAIGPAPGVLHLTRHHVTREQGQAGPQGKPALSGGLDLKLRCEASPLVMRAPVELRAHGRAAIPSKFSGTAYSGGLVVDRGMVVDLASTTYKPRMPLLDSHRSDQVVGVIDRTSVIGGKLVISGDLFSDMPGSAAERIAQLAARGAPWELSIGIYGAVPDRVSVNAGTVEVNGRQFAAPVTVLRGGQVREVSIVTLGADPATDAAFFSG